MNSLLPNNDGWTSNILGDTWRYDVDARADHMTNAKQCD